MRERGGVPRLGWRGLAPGLLGWPPPQAGGWALRPGTTLLLLHSSLNGGNGPCQVGGRRWRSLGRLAWTPPGLKPSLQLSTRREPSGPWRAVRGDFAGRRRTSSKLQLSRIDSNFLKRASGLNESTTPQGKDRQLPRATSICKTIHSLARSSQQIPSPGPQAQEEGAAGAGRRWLTSPLPHHCPRLLLLRPRGGRSGSGDPSAPTPGSLPGTRRRGSSLCRGSHGGARKTLRPGPSWGTSASAGGRRAARSARAQRPQPGWVLTARGAAARRVPSPRPAAALRSRSSPARGSAAAAPLPRLASDPTAPPPRCSPGAANKLVSPAFPPRLRPETNHRRCLCD